MSESRKAVIHIINKFKVKTEDQAFRCIMIYQDTHTGFCFIKPLLFKIDLEIVMELFKIFTSYGPPSELHVNSCTQEMVDNISMHMKALCPMFNINFVKKNGACNNIAMKVVTKLHEWMEKTNKQEWEIGCYIVQRGINTAVPDDATSLSPHELFFKELGKGHDSKKGTQNKDTSLDVTQEQNISKVLSFSESNSKTLNDSLDTVKVKEEIVNSEEMNSINNRMVVFEGGLILPGLKKVIKIERLDE